MKHNTNLAKVFEHTRSLSQTKYAKDTKQLRNNTQVWLSTSAIELPLMIKEPKIEFTKGGTVETGYNELLKFDRVAILNFADALRPGGLVLAGATTQEENICRCSNLYESLLLGKCARDYYKYNEWFAHQYSDRIIYSPNVTIFKDDKDYTEITPKKLDVITCPAPACRLDPVKAYEVFYSRAVGIIKTAISNNVQCLVLGAWGCGAFGQDPYIVGRVFADVLTSYPYFDKVVFAIRHQDSSIDGGNYNKFKKAFDNAYGEY